MVPPVPSQEARRRRAKCSESTSCYSVDSRGSSATGSDSGPRVPRLPSAAKCAKSELPSSGIGKHCNPRCSPLPAWYPTHFWDNQPRGSLSTSLHEGFWIHRAIYPLKAAHNYRSRSSLSTCCARHAGKINGRLGNTHSREKSTAADARQPSATYGEFA